MQKGKLGFFLWLYPFLALWSMLVGSFVATLLITGFATVLERDEWCSKQCLHVVMFQIYWSVLNVVMSFLKQIPLAGVVFTVIDFIVWLVLLVLVLVVGLGRLKNGKDSGLPGKGIVNRAYGLMQQYVQMPSQQAEYRQPRQEPFTQAQQPVQPTYTPPQASPAGGFAPPPAPPRSFTPPTAPPKH